MTDVWFVPLPKHTGYQPSMSDPPYIACKWAFLQARSTHHPRMPSNTPYWTPLHPPACCGPRISMLSWLSIPGPTVRWPSAAKSAPHSAGVSRLPGHHHPQHPHPNSRMWRWSSCLRDKTVGIFFNITVYLFWKNQPFQCFITSTLYFFIHSKIAATRLNSIDPVPALTVLMVW